MDKKDLPIVLILLLISPLFFYKLGQSSLVSWDEAWYAQVSKNILKTKDLFNLTWNGSAYFDHPPASYWLTALTFGIFGINEFWARFPQAVAGLASVLILYFLGKELFNREIGLASAIALPSASWFLFRSRSGNLDVALTMFFLATLLLGIKASKEKIYLIPFCVSFTLLILTKTLIPLTIIPALIIIFWRNKLYRLREILLSFCLILVISGSWFAVQTFTHPTFLSRVFAIGLPAVSFQTSIWENLSLVKQYLHVGVGKWFWPGIASILVGLFLKQKRFLVLGLFFITFLPPFLFSPKGQIWHLIPLHPILILSFFGLFFTLVFRTTKNKLLTLFLMFVISIYFSYIQIKRSWIEFIDIPPYISDEAILSKEAAKFSQDFYIDDEFLPSAVFYSDKNVRQIKKDEQLKDLFAGGEFILITYKWHLDKVGIKAGDYQLIKQDRDKILIRKADIMEK